MKKLFTILFIFLAFSIGYAGKPVEKAKIQKAKIQASDFSKPKPLLRLQDFMSRRMYPNTNNPNEARLNAIKQSDIMMYSKKSSALVQALQPEWRCIGPFSVGGRIKSIVVHPTKKDWVYVGAAAGGIWLSTDGGDNWKPIFDYENAISFGSIAIDNNNPDVLYAGTGEAVLGGGSAYMGCGIYKSIDGGNTWTIKGLAEVGAFSKVYVHPKNSNLIYAGVVQAGNGFYKSTDAGESWIKTENFSKNVSDVTINPNNENEVFVGVTDEGIYQSVDGGATFVLKNSGLATGIGRVSLQFAPSNPDVLYSLMEINDLGRICKSTNHGQSWNTCYQGEASFFNGQGFYDNYISVSPTNDNFVIAGGIDCWRTTNGGQAWYNITNSYPLDYGNPHPDQHCATFDPNSNSTIYFGNDGGVYKTTDNGGSIGAKNNGLEVTQFYNMAIDPTELNKTYGGTQDNGTLGNISTGNDWSQVYSGDGFNTEVGKENPDMVYGEVATVSGSDVYIVPWRRSVANGSNSILSYGLSSSDLSLWNPPLKMDQQNNFVLYHGRHALYQSQNNGDSWLSVTNQRDNRFSAIGISQVNAEVIYAGDEAGDLLISKDFCSTPFIDLSENISINRFMTDIEPSNINEATVFITFSGYGSGHIFKSTDFGENWTDISTTFPDVPVNALAIYPTHEDWLFAATDIGVYATFDGGTSWFPFGRKLPRSPVMDIAFHTHALLDKPVLRVATHGRSMWEIDVADEIVSEPGISSPSGGEVFYSGNNLMASWYGFDLPVKVEYSFDDGSNWDVLTPTYNFSSIEWTLPTRITCNSRIRVSSLSNPAQVKITNTFSIQPRQKGSIDQISVMGQIPYGLCWDGKDGLWTTSFQTNKLYKLNANTLILEKKVSFTGDSLYSDITMDREKGIFYIHKMDPGATVGNGFGGDIITLDTNGKILNEYKSPVANYPIGLELVDGKLLACDRDGLRFMTYIKPATGETISETENPYQHYAGPRSICYDGSQYLYQVSTYFPDNNSPLTETLILQIDKSNIGKEVKRMSLIFRGSPINARGIEYDPRDKNFWISDFGSVYKIAGFETVMDVHQESTTTEAITADVFPNPMKDFTTVSFRANQDNSHLTVVITNLLGEKIGTYYDGKLNKSDSAYFQLNGDNISTGIYSITFFVNGNQASTKKLIVIR